MQKIIKFFKPWNWAILKVYTLLIVLIIGIHLSISISINSQAVEVQGDVKYIEAAGLFAPALYMFETGAKAMLPVLKFAAFIVIIIESFLLFTLSFIMIFIFMKKRWILIPFVPLSIFMGLIFSDEGNNPALALFYIFIVIIAVMTWFKNNAKLEEKIRS